ncbi:MAG: hypothetical protein H6772_04980 [Pseudomonadales bacterium]|nr:hypothetical protein [Pseudomonadales bacterium]
MSKYDRPQPTDFIEALSDTPSVTIAREACLNFIDNFSGFIYLKTKIQENQYDILMAKLNRLVEVAILEQANEDKEKQHETKGWQKDELENLNNFIQELELSDDDLQFLQTFISLITKIAQQLEFMVRVEQTKIPEITEENFRDLLDALDKDYKEGKVPFTISDTKFGEQWKNFITPTDSSIA